MKIVIPGGSGQVGTVLARAFQRDGHDVVVLSRGGEAVRTAKSAGSAKSSWRVVPWDAQRIGSWTAEFEGADVVVNLAGRSVNCRYNARARREIMESRVRSTRLVGEAIGAARNPPRVWLQASTATIYAHRYDAPNDEGTGIIGGDEPDAPDTWKFSIEVAKAWERAVDESPTPGTRKVKLRSAMVMSPDKDGIFDTLLTLVRRGLGGTAADGRQYISWIHETDFIRSLYWLIGREDMDGAVNVAAPNPLPNKEFMRILRNAAGVRIGLPATRLMLEAGAFFMRSETELILKSRRVVPGRMLEAGFDFVFPQWEQAARDLCERARAS
ncbi:MAG TPA: DUF1731 domain-containing protein [Gemmatimonadaceae bacterium]